MSYMNSFSPRLVFLLNSIVGVNYSDTIHKLTLKDTKGLRAVRT